MTASSRAHRASAPPGRSDGSFARYSSTSASSSAGTGARELADGATECVSGFINYTSGRVRLLRQPLAKCLGALGRAHAGFADDLDGGGPDEQLVFPEQTSPMPPDPSCSVRL